MITRLGQVAQRGAQDPATALAPFVEGLLATRERARADRRFDEADGVRDLLVGLGVEVNDSPDGTSWHLHSDRSAPS
jgi:cysteinyl-tRNA synthetase